MRLLGLRAMLLSFIGLTDDEKYARLAAGVFDTYMQGIYYRNVPVDLNHGHQQTFGGYEFV